MCCEVYEYIVLIQSDDGKTNDLNGLLDFKFLTSSTAFAIYLDTYGKIVYNV